jgi:hypothetical protein
MVVDCQARPAIHHAFGIFGLRLGQLVKREVQRQRFFGSYPVTDESPDPLIAPIAEQVREEPLVRVGVEIAIQ